MDQVSILTLAKALFEVALKFKPDIVFSHHPGDVNVDHRRVSEAAEIAFRPSGDLNVRCVYFFETLSSSEWNITRPLQSFTPNTYINIDNWLEQKILALRAYESELRSYPHPRSPEGLTSQAKWRGLAAGLRSAEAFSVGRQVLL
jgi:LmbE family N-acetylglucosaminyl deacetylase